MAPLKVEPLIDGVDDDIEPSDASDVKDLLLFAVSTSSFACEINLSNASRFSRDPNSLAEAPALE